MKKTRYFEEEVLRRRPYIKNTWLKQALSNPEYKEVQPNGRVRHWVFIEELGKHFRVVTLPDG